MTKNCDAYVTPRKSELGATLATTSGGVAYQGAALHAPDFAMFRDDPAELAGRAPRGRRPPQIP